MLSAFRRCQGGTAAVEFAVVGSLLILVSLGIIEFGRGLLVRNELSYLADLGSRQILLDPAIPDGTLRSRMQAAFSGDDAALQLSTALETIDGIKYRSVSVTYPLTLLVPGLAEGPLNLSITRRVPVG
jgi:Flp pilus assembly protein TadG